MCGSVPDGGEGGVRLEEVCHDLCTINTKLVASDAANENQTKVSGGADGRDTVGKNALEFDQSRILFQVVCKKHGVPNFEAVSQEVGLCLVRLEATERSELRFALCDVQNGLCSFLTNVVSQQAANGSRIATSGGIDISNKGVEWLT